MILDEAVEGLSNIVAYIASENPSVAGTLGEELLGEAMSLQSLPNRGSPVVGNLEERTVGAIPNW